MEEIREQHQYQVMIKDLRRLLGRDWLRVTVRNDQLKPAVDWCIDKLHLRKDYPELGPHLPETCYYICNDFFFPTEDIAIRFKLSLGDR